MGGPAKLSGTGAADVPRKADTPCAGGCGKLLYLGSGSLAQPTCRECRRACTTAIWAAAPPCMECGGRMSDGWIWYWSKGRISGPSTCKSCERRLAHEARLAPMRTCTRCGMTKPRSEFGEDKRVKDGLDFYCKDCMREVNREYNARRNWETQQRKDQIQGRKRRNIRYATWDGITDREIFDRDGWECKMPVCLNPNSRSISRVAWPDPWSRSVDHIVRLADGGEDTAGNKRAAHLRCNTSAGSRPT